MAQPADAAQAWQWRRGTQLDALYAALGATFVALVTGVFTWIVARPKTKADIQSVLNSTFEMMLKRLDAENVVLKEDIATIRQQAQREQSEQRRQMLLMQDHIGKIEQILHSHGIPFEPLEINFPIMVDGDPE